MPTIKSRHGWPKVESGVTFVSDKNFDPAADRNRQDYRDKNYAARLRSQDEDNCYGKGRHNVACEEPSHVTKNHR